MFARGKPTQGSLRLYFVRIFYLAYIIIIFLASSKSVRTKMSEIYIYKRRMISGNTHDSLGKSAELLMIGRRNAREHS